MNFDGYHERLRAHLAERFGEPVEALLLVHPSPEKGRGPGGRLRTNNALALTPTSLRLVALGGRSGLRPRREIARWDRRFVVVDVWDTEEQSWFNTTMSWYRWDVHRLRICGPDRTLVVDAMRANAHTDPEPELQALFAAVGSGTAA